MIDERSIPDVIKRHFWVAFVGDEELDARTEACLISKQKTAFLFDDGGECHCDSQGKLGDGRATKTEDIHCFCLTEQNSGEEIAARSIDPDVPAAPLVLFDEWWESVLRSGVDVQVIVSGFQVPGMSRVSEVLCK